MRHSRLNYLALLTGVALSSLAFALPVAAHPAPFTIDQVMQAPYPSDLTAAPHGKDVAWVFDTKGVRNVWVAGSAKAHQVTQFTDDGFNVDEIAWSADEQHLAFTRGGSLEDSPPANINSLPTGPEPREIYIVAASGGAAQKVGAGNTPSFSPDNSQLIFLDKGKIYSVAANGTGAVSTLVSDMGYISATEWSPDGKRLAFVSSRGSHSFVGVLDLAQKSITWLAPSLDHDGAPVFSPDGTKVAFIRVPDEKRPEFISHPVGVPWSIWVADVATGQGKRVWVADEGRGSAFARTLADRNLFWMAQDQLVFPWEKSGWLQLYAVPASGGPARALTKGNFEVAHMAASADRTQLLISSNQDDIDRMHVWSVDVAHGQVSRLGDDHAIESLPQITPSGDLYAFQSDGDQPLHPVVLNGGKWQPVAPDQIPSTFPSSKLVTPQSITFTARDGQLVHAQVFVPKDGAKSHPALLFFHGGPRRQMLLGFHPMDAYNWMYAMNQYMVAKGYVVISVNYRGGIGYGTDYREAKDFGPGGGSELNDLLGAVDYLKSRKDVDPKRLGIWGASYGGLMTALGLSRDSADIAAGVDYAGLYNWATFLESIGLPVDAGDATKTAVASSPIATIDKWTSPVLLVQADDDRNVPSRQATELIQDLRSHKIDHEELIIPNEIHDLTRYSSWLTLFTAGDAYFTKKLETPATPAK